MLDSFWGIIIPYSFSVWSVFFMRQYMKGIPDDLLDAARMDGASEFHIYWKVVMPLCGPVLAAQAIFTFTFVWNDFFWPLIVISDPRAAHASIGLALFVIKNRTVWDIVFAGSVISTLPVSVDLYLLPEVFHPRHCPDRDEVGFRTSPEFTCHDKRIPSPAEASYVCL